MHLCSKVIAVTLLAAAAPWLVAPAGAVPIGSLAGLHDQVAPSAEAVQFRRGGGWRGGGGWRRGRGFGIGAGLAAGAIIGGAIAGSRAYGYGPYGYGPGYGYVEPGYIEDDIDEGYVAVAPRGGGGAASCAQRYRSYDPASGTFLGFDGLRHPCP